MSTIYALFEKPKNSIGKYEIPVGLFSSYFNAEQVALIMSLKNKESYTIGKYEVDSMYEESKDSYPKLVLFKGIYSPETRHSNDNIIISSISSVDKKEDIKLDFSDEDCLGFEIVIDFSEKPLSYEHILQNITTKMEEEWKEHRKDHS